MRLIRSVLGAMAVFLIVAGRPTAAQPQSPGPVSLHASVATDASLSAPTLARYRAVLDRYCVTCHNEKLRTAGLVLDKADIGNLGAQAEIWEKVARKLRTDAMPPPGLPRPDKATYDSFAAYLEAGLDLAAADRPNPGRPVAHRLNRVEYANAVRDLIGVEVDGAALFPAEDSGKGFDNLASLLSVSPLLMERYISAAARISRIAVGDRTARPVSETYHVAENLRGSAGVVSVQDDRASDDLPFGSRGGIAVRHHFAADGEYQVKVRLQLDGNYYIRGLLGEPHRLDLFLEGTRIQSFTVGGERRGASGALHTRDGNIFIGDPAQQEYEYFSGGDLEARFHAKAGTRMLGAAFLKKTYEQEGLLEVSPRPMARDISNYKGGDPGVASVTITGPLNPTGTSQPTRRSGLFACPPAGGAPSGASQLAVSLKTGPDAQVDLEAEESCARAILSTLARRGYRRPVTDAEVQTLLDLYRAGSAKEGFDAGMQWALQGMLVSPAFLFRIERDPRNAAPGAVHRVSDLDLASRLSFFLWSSIPDEQLLKLAESGMLGHPDVLEGQIRRMLADRRSQALVENFAGQWLQLRNVGSRTPNASIFVDFDDELRRGLRQETELFFNSMLRQDASVLDLLSADYTFVNERLARHYGIPNVFGSHFRRVKLADENRRGLLGQGSILLITSRANRTSPVLRGKWVLDNLLGMPPPPPPPDVPPLKERQESGRALSMRERTEEHRSNPACASCHARMDPIGFALENFDGVGKWRTMEGTAPVDSTGVLPDGTRFEGPAGLRRVLLSRPEQFAQTVAEKLLTYALGREVEYYDMPAVRRILAETAPGGYRWSSLIAAVVKSTPFQMRKAQP